MGQHLKTLDDERGDPAARPRRHGRHRGVRTGPTAPGAARAPGSFLCKSFCAALTLTETRQDLANFGDQRVKMGKRRRLSAGSSPCSRDTRRRLQMCLVAAWAPTGGGGTGIQWTETGVLLSLLLHTGQSPRPRSIRPTRPQRPQRRGTESLVWPRAGLQGAAAGGPGGAAPACWNASASSRPDVVLRPAPGG